MKSKPASKFQELFWLTWKSNPFQPSLVLPYIYRLRGKIEIQRLEKAINTYIQRFHLDCLSSFENRKGTLFQHFENEQFLSLKYLDLRSEKKSASEILGSFLSEPFNLQKSPLARFILAQIKRKEFLFGFSFSHSIFDGMSLAYFFDCLSQIYNKENLQFEKQDVILTDLEEKETSKGLDLSFWKEELEGVSFSQSLSFKMKTGDPDSKKRTRSFSITGSLFAQVKNFLIMQRLTSFRFLTSVHIALLGKYKESGSLDRQQFVIGHAISTREENKNNGCFVNFLPLKVGFDSFFTPLECIEEVKNARKRIKQHQNFSFLELIQCFPFVAKRQDFFDLIVNESPGTVHPNLLHFNDSIKVELIRKPSVEGRYTLGLHFAESLNSLELVFGYDSQALTDEWVEIYLSHYIEMLQFFIRNKTTSLKEWKFNAVLPDFLKTPPKIQKGILTLDEALDKALKKGGDKIAIRFGNESLTYAQLAKKVGEAAQLISYTLFKSNGKIKKQEYIGIYIDRSVDMLVSLLAILKAGHVFLPLDPSYPPSRLLLYTREANCKWIISNEAMKKLYPNSPFFYENNIYLILFDQPSEEIVSNENYEKTLAYLLFTSGSTGKPKGIKISRDNLLYFLTAIQELIQFREDGNFLAATSLNFDISLMELLLPILFGGSITLIDRKTAQNGIELGKTLNENSVNFFQATPSTWRILQSISWRPDRKMTLISGGEPLNESIAEFLLERSECVFNLYGPTETTIWASGEIVKPHTPISIGRPLPGTTFYIRSSEGNICPLGKTGELCIAGPGVAQGCLNTHGSSAFFEKDEVINERFYRTGDLVTYLGNGIISFVGRMNDEVKVRGHRISLKEIQDAILVQYKGSQVEVVVRKEPEEYLVCFIRSSVEENYGFLSKKLVDQFPSYMIPQQFISLKQLPLLPNAKINRKFLESENLKTIVAQYGFNSLHFDTQATNEKLNDNLSNILRDLIEHNFGIKIINDQESIASYGLQSISMNRLAKEINQKFGVKFSPHTFFQHNTVEEISRLILRKQNGDAISFRAEQNEVPLEKRIWDIGIIGMSGLFPQSSTLLEFWSNLFKDKNSISCHTRSYLPPHLKAGFIDKIDQFDPAFFNISPLEAGAIDPQQRLLMEMTWHAIEDAGYDPLSLANQKIGVYVTSTSSDYWLLQNKYLARISPYTIGGFSNAMLANRLSYFFNWSGPSMHIETACSGSLSAFAKACEDLVQGKCDWAIVGATNLILSPEYHSTLEKSSLLSPTHRCAALDASANGYVRGEGIGCLVLRRSSDLKLHKERCYGFVESIAENHGGKAHSLSAPRQGAQTELLLAAYSKALAKQVSYIELHGTGTKLGDPIEVDALKDAWNQLGLNNPCNNKIFLGSIKTHIGHLEAVAGLASIIKVLLAFKYKKLPKNGHFQHLNPLISLEGTNFSVLQENIEWNNLGEDRVAGISSFGFGGSNVHVVLRECSVLPSVNIESSSPELFCLSARSLFSLKKRLEELCNWLKNETSKTRFSIKACAYTLNSKRTHFEFRTTFIASTREELIQKLEEKIKNEQPILRTKPTHQKIDFHLSLTEERHAFLQQIAQAYLRGSSINWDTLYSTMSNTSLLDLPFYPFKHASYWFETADNSEPWDEIIQHPIKRKKSEQISIHSSTPGIFQVEISVDHHWLKDHLVCGTSILPGVAYLELVYQCFVQTNSSLAPNYFYNVYWINPLICLSQQLKFEIHFEPIERGAAYTLLSQGKIYGSGMIGCHMDSAKPFQSSEAICQKYLEGRQNIYALFDKGNISYGLFFQNIHTLSMYPQWSEVKIILEETKDLLKTNLLDCAMQSILGLSLSEPNQPLLPFAIGQLRFYDAFFTKTDQIFYVVTRKISNFRVDIFVLDSSKKEVLIEYSDVGVRQVNYEIFKINKSPLGNLS